MRMQATAWCGCFCRSASRQAGSTAHDMYLSPPGYLSSLGYGGTLYARTAYVLASPSAPCTNRSPAPTAAALGPDAERHALSSLRSSADAKPNLDATASLWARCSASRINCGLSCAKRPSPGFVIFPAKNALPSGVGGGGRASRTHGIARTNMRRDRHRHDN